MVESGEAYRRGVRPNMVIKAMTGTSGDERTEVRCGGLTLSRLMFFLFFNVHRADAAFHS